MVVREHRVMVVRVQSTLDSYRALAACPPADRSAAWQRYEDDHRAVFDLYAADGRAGDDRRARAVADVPVVVPGLDEAERRARAALDCIDEGLCALGLGGADLPAVLMVGMGSANGWVSVLEGRPTFFVDVAMLPAFPFDGLLALHEGVHVVHWSRQRPSARRSVAEELLGEGMAVWATRAVRGDLSDSAHLWVDDDHQWWVDRCAAMAEDLVGRCSDHLGQVAEDVDRAMFSFGEGGLPDRYGYWVGLHVIDHLLGQGWTLASLMEVPPAEATQVIGGALAAKRWS